MSKKKSSWYNFWGFLAEILSFTAEVTLALAEGLPLAIQFILEIIAAL